MIARRLSVLGITAALALSGCAVQRSDFDALRDQVRLQQKQINDLKARQDEQVLRVETMNNGFKILVDKVEENGRNIDEMGERSAMPARQDTASVTPAPLAAAPPARTPVPTPAATPAAPAEESILLTNRPKGGAAPSPGAQIITAGPKPEKLYAGALNLYSHRNYQQATVKFQEFVDSYPEHKLAGNAQYWIGESLYSQKRFTEAAEEFGKVEKAHPESPKVPASLLKKGLSLVELNQIPEARAALQRLIDNHGQSEEAAKARDRLERLKRQ